MCFCSLSKNIITSVFFTNLLDLFMLDQPKQFNFVRLFAKYVY